MPIEYVSHQEPPMPPRDPAVPSLAEHVRAQLEAGGVTPPVGFAELLALGRLRKALEERSLPQDVRKLAARRLLAAARMSEECGRKQEAAALRQAAQVIQKCKPPRSRKESPDGAR